LVVDEVRKITSHACKKQFAVLCKRMVEMFPKSLEDSIDGNIIGSGSDSLVQQMISRNENLNRPKHLKRKTLDETPPLERRSDSETKQHTRDTYLQESTLIKKTI